MHVHQAHATCAECVDTCAAAFGKCQQCSLAAFLAVFCLYMSFFRQLTISCTQCLQLTDVSLVSCKQLAAVAQIQQPLVYSCCCRLGVADAAVLHAVLCVWLGFAFNQVCTDITAAMRK